VCVSMCVCYNVYVFQCVCVLRCVCCGFVAIGPPSEEVQCVLQRVLQYVCVAVCVLRVRGCWPPL